MCDTRGGLDRILTYYSNIDRTYDDVLRNVRRVAVAVAVGVCTLTTRCDASRGTGRYRHGHVATTTE